MYGRPPPQQWQANPNNPNLAPVGPRGGIGSGPPPVNGLPPGPPPPGVGPAVASGPNASPNASTTVFVGSITAGISDNMLTQLLNTCGSLLTLKRISPAFGFATFDHPEAVMRAIDLLNGLELPVPGGSEGVAAKKLLVKADEKTKAFVEQYKVERGEGREEHEEQRDGAGKDGIASFIATLQRPDVLTLFPDAAGASSSSRPGGGSGVAAHLKDLPPEDLPEEHRNSVLSEIDKFRQASAAREDEKRRRERVLERERMGAPTGPRDTSSPMGSSGLGGSGGTRDPQSFNHGAPGFVRSSTDINGAAAEQRRREDMDPEEADEAEEQRRLSSKHAEEARRAEEALAKHAQQERARLDHWTRIIDDGKREAERRASRAEHMAQRLRCDPPASDGAGSSGWDDEHERQRDPFYIDRRRWRHARSVALRREQEDDLADERREAVELERARQEEERARIRREEEEKKLREEQRKAGVLLGAEGEHKPLKLKNATGVSGAAGPSSSTTTGATGGSTAATGAPVFSSALGEDDEEGAEGSSRARKNMAHLLDDLPPTNGASAQDDASTKERRLAIRASLDEVDRLDLFSSRGPSSDTKILWSYLSLPSLSAFVGKLVRETVGEAVPELEEVVIERLTQFQQKKAGAGEGDARDGAQLARDIGEAVEPVLADEAGAFTERLWRWLVEETQIAGGQRR
ncbi:hypothetical protein BDZ90DRAFT_228976 [Jaminaea rosea]|uniref:RRM domain-containing protein n=1 Tax=Jaminaea rosea TaxID=1569628 RepID=A0A316UXI8_9BASI|nr:hypothetical protein BDZ90DRAFT_228976 [Jaminaea rosea]PWN29932.1 hypothetical protein BDZ90DRAFT_228976 [Jaminaea rosea]